MGQEFARIIHDEDLDDYRRVGFSESQIQSIKEKFNNKCGGSNVMSRRNFSQLLQLSEATAQPVSLIADPSQIFEFIDMDQNSSIDDYEFICGLALFTRTSLDERLEGIFNLYDKDRSELLSREEFKVLIQTILSVGDQETPTKEKISQKFQELVQDYHLTDDHATLADFKRMCRQDMNFANSLHQLGIFDGDEIDPDGYDEDLDNEILKGNVEKEDDGNMKMGIDSQAEDIGNGVFQLENVDEGDQFMAIKPWEGTVRNSVPSQYKPSPGDGQAPDASLQLEYVHGYRCHDTRNNIRYTPEGKIVYHTAAVGIVMSPDGKDQQFMFDHSDDIMCMDAYKNLTITGEIGNKPVLCLWDNTTMEPIATLVGTLRKGISNVCFSHDGKMVAALSMDQDHTLAVFSVDSLVENRGVGSGKSSAMLVSSRGPRDDILDMRFAKVGGAILAGSKKNLYFIKAGTKGGWRSHKANGWPKKKAQPTISIGFFGNDAVTGSKDGKIYVWKGQSHFKTLTHGKKGFIYCMNERPGGKGFLSGSSDGTLVIWGTKYDQLHTIEINSQGYKSLMPKLRSCAESEDGKIVIGTRASEIFEISADYSKKTLLNIGHYDYELWGLAMVPESDHYITCGEDFMLAMWDITKKKMLKVHELKFQAKTLHVSDKGSLIAVGMTNGWVQIFDLDFKEIKTIEDRKKEISEVKFSPDGQYLAVGAHDSRIIVYDTSSYRKKGTCCGHHSTITHIDWSQDSSYFQSTCTSYELLYWTVDNCKQNTRGASSYRDEKWNTLNCVLGWSVQGIWPPCSDGSDINSVDRNDDMTILATADDFGNVKLFKYPVNEKKASYQRFSGHSSHVTNVNFSSFENYAISTGGNDKAIFQWKFRVDSDEVVEYDNEGYDESEYDYEKIDIAEGNKISDKGADDIKKMGIFAMEKVHGDQMGAVKPFLGEVRASVPSNFKEEPRCNEPPQATLNIHHVNGFRCFDTRNACKFLESHDQVGFISAALGITMDTNTFQQEYFNEHDEDLVSFDIHPNFKYAATGQMAAKGRSRFIDVFVWDLETKQKVATLTGFHRGAIKLIKFSPDGSKLLTFGRDDHNSLALYDWENERLIGTSKVDQAIVLDASWDLSGGARNFTSVGPRHVKMWSVSGSTISSSRGKWGSSKAEVLTSALRIGSTSITGSGKGNLYKWSGTSTSKPIKAHKGPVYVLCYNQNTKNILSGGKDGKVVEWTMALKKQREIVDFSPLSKLQPSIKCIDIHKDGKHLLVGTGGSDLFKMEMEGLKPKLIMSGHYDGELWGCAVHPSNDQYVTCGGDNTVRLWSILEKRQLNVHQFEMDVRACDWSDNGDHIVVASNSGMIFLFNSSLELLDSRQSSFTKKNQWIEDVKFNPQGTMIAFGAHGGASPLEVLSVVGGKLKKKCKFNVGMTSALLHLDWSTSGENLIMNSQAYELKYANVNNKDVVRSSSMKDEEWSTFTCVLGFPVQGIFPGVDGTDVNTVCRAKNCKVMATGDDFQKVNLFKYPSVKPRSGCVRFTAHASHVTRVKFMMNDNVLVSTGGNDKVNIVWTTDFGGEHDLKSSLFEGGQAAQIEDDFGFAMPKKLRNKYGDEGGEVVDTFSSAKESTVFHQLGQGSALFGSNPNASAFEGFQGFQVEEVNEGDEFMAVKPWKGAIKEPSNYTPPQGYDKPPNVDLQLDYVYGYRCKDCRNNIWYSQDGNSMIYHAAAVGIVHNVKDNTQRHFIGHNDDIISMAACPKGENFATGEIGPRPSIFIWSSKTLEKVTEITTGVKKGVCNLSFSPDGSKLVATCMDDNHKVVCFNISPEGGASVKFMNDGGVDLITGVLWKDESSFVTYGIKHYKTWDMNGKSDSGRSKILFTSGAVANNKAILGDFKGNFCVNGSVTKKGLHTKSIDAIWVSTSAILTGGRDRKVMVLDPSRFEVMAEFDVMGVIPSVLNGKVRAICIDESSSKMALGLHCGDIHEINYTDLTKANLTPSALKGKSQAVNHSHFAKNAKWTNEVWGLATLKDNDHFITVSDDGTFRKWSSSRRKMVNLVRLDIDKKGRILPADKKTGDLQDQAKLRSVAINPAGTLAAVGCKEGSIRLIDLTSKQPKQLTILKKRKRWIEDLKFSPDGKRLAVGSHDAWIDIYSVPSFKLLRKIKKHSAFITHLDWSTNSEFIHSNCGAYELLFFNAITGQQMTRGASDLRNEEWHTWSCVLGWPVEGIFRGTMDGSDVNKVNRSNNSCEGNYKLLACADDFSKVKVFRYPVLEKTSGFVEGEGHSSHVTNVEFSAEDTFLYSTGGEDQCVFQWKVQQKNGA